MIDIASVIGEIPQKIDCIKNKYYNKLEDIDGRIDYEFYDKGFCLSKEGNVNYINAIFIYSDEYGNGYKGYTEELPLGIDFNMSRDEVHILLGKPSFSREEIAIPAIGMVNPLDNYDKGNIKISINYGKSKRYIVYIVLSLL